MSKRTPLLDLGGGLYAKYEGVQPTGSVKDRAVLPMMAQFPKEKEFLLADWGAFALAAANAAKIMGRKLHCFLPEDAPGVFTEQLPDAKRGGTLSDLRIMVRKMAEKEPKYALLEPELDPEHPMAYCESLAEELWQQCEDMTAFVSSVESCAAFMGTVTGLKQKNPNLLAVAAAISQDFYGNADPLGAEDPEFFVPQLCDRIFYCSMEEAEKTRLWFMEKTGLPCGIVGGTALHAARQLLCEQEKIIVLIPSRYGCY